MYLFARTGSITPGRFLDGMAFAMEAATKVETMSGVHFNLYNTVFGAPVGTVLWTTRYDSMTEASDVQAKLMADPGYLELMGRGGTLFASTSDSLNTVVSASGLEAPKPIYEATNAVIANGKLSKAMAFGVKVQEYVAGATGLATAFVAGAYGPYGGVGWLIGGDSMADIDTFHTMRATDAGFLAMVEEAGDLFVEGSGAVALIQKVN